MLAFAMFAGYPAGDFPSHWGTCISSATSARERCFRSETETSGWGEQSRGDDLVLLGVTFSFKQIEGDAKYDFNSNDFMAL